GQLPHQRGDGHPAAGLGGGIESPRSFLQPGEAARPIAGVGPGLLDHALDERLDLAQHGHAGKAGAAQQAERLKERGESERQRLGRPLAGHGASASSGSSAYSTKTTSRISYSRSPPGARILTVSPTSR